MPNRKLVLCLLSLVACGSGGDSPEPETRDATVADARTRDARPEVRLERDTSVPPRDAAPAAKQAVKSLAVGPDRSCALLEDQTLKCWGHRYEQTVPPPVPFDFDQIYVGDGIECGLRADGSAACWGDCEADRCAVPNDTFRELAVGLRHGCGLKADGSARCWGDNASKEATPPEGKRFKQLSAGMAATCGVTQEDSLVCWGFVGAYENLPAITPVKQVSVFGNSNYALRPDGSAVAFGRQAGQDAIPSEFGYSSISAGSYVTCGLLADGSVRCGGLNSQGRLDVPDVKFSEVHCGVGFSCGLTAEERRVVCWGARGRAGGDEGQTTPPPEAAL
jgi:alpha-tubulin suppressor-like RCC1 family protein